MATKMGGDDLEESDPSLDTSDSEDNEEYSLPPLSVYSLPPLSAEDDEGLETNVDDDEGSYDDPSEEESYDEDPSEGEASEQGDAENAEGENKTLEKDGEESVGHESKQKNVKPMDADESSESRRNKVEADKSEKIESSANPKTSRKINWTAKFKSVGLIFFCSSKTKEDCFRYKVFGLPESKKDIVEKIHRGMRLFLYDVDLKVMYGIFKAVEPGGYNIEPKAFRSEFPAQVRYTVLDDCFPLAEEEFRKVIEKNYFTRTKFNCQLNSFQVRQLCKLFITSTQEPRRTEPNRVPKAAKFCPLTIRERGQSERIGRKRQLAPREDRPRRELPHKRARKIISKSSFAYERPYEADSYRRDSYRHDPYRESHDPLPIEHRDSYRDGVRESYVSSRNSYRDAREPYIDQRDRCRDGQGSYSEPRSDRYKDRRRNLYSVERVDPHRDTQVPSSSSYQVSRDPYMDRFDRSYAEQHALYRDEPYGAYNRNPRINRSRDAYRDATRVVEYGDIYRRGEPLELDRVESRSLSLETRRRGEITERDPYRGEPLELNRVESRPLSLETRRCDEIIERDPYRLEPLELDQVESRPLSLGTRRRGEIIECDPCALCREHPTLYSESNSIYSADYPSRAGLARHYHL